MVGNDKIQAVLLCLFDGPFRHVKRKEHSCTDVCRIACLQSSVIVTFLEGSRGKILNRVNHTANVHCSNMSAKLVIIVEESIIFVEKYTDGG